MNRLLVCTCVGVGVLALAAGSAAGAVQVFYTFEPPDSGTTATDRLTGDGAQPITFGGATSVDPAAANAAFGTQSVNFPDAVPFDRLTLGGTQSLGSAFTIAAMIDPADNKWTRTFSTYAGSGSPAANAVALSFRPSGATANGLAFTFNGAYISPASPHTFTPGSYHHIAATYDNGLGKIYFDGAEKASGTIGSGAITMPQDFFFGEDIGGSVNEQFFGNADDILVYNEAMAPEQIWAMSRAGVQEALKGHIGVLYNAEGDSGSPARDKLLSDAAQHGTFSDGFISIDTNPANARFGQQSIGFANDTSALHTIEIPDSTYLGPEFTLAAFVEDAGHHNWTRLVGNYRGSGSAVGDEVALSFDPSGTVRNGLNFGVNGVNVQAASALSFADSQYHHLAATYSDGQVVVYLDGDPVGSGTAGSGPVTVWTNLLIGEDTGGGTGQEQLRGNLDDFVFLRRALSDDEIAFLAARGADAFFQIPEPASGVVFLVLVLLGLAGSARRGKR